MANFEPMLKLEISSKEEKHPRGEDIVPFEEIHQYLDTADIDHLIEGERYLIHNFYIVGNLKNPYHHLSYTIVEYVGKDEKGNLLTKELFGKRYDSSKKPNHSPNGWFNIPRIMTTLDDKGRPKETRLFKNVKTYEIKQFPGTNAYEKARNKRENMMSDHYVIKELGPKAREITMEIFDDESERRATQIMNEILEEKFEYETEEEEEEEEEKKDKDKDKNKKKTDLAKEDANVDDTDSEDQGLIFKDSDDERETKGGKKTYKKGTHKKEKKQKKQKKQKTTRRKTKVSKKNNRRQKISGKRRHT